MPRASRQTRLKLKKGFHNAPLTYQVLMVSQFNKQDEKELAKGMIKALTPEKAKILLPTSDKPTKWSMPLAIFNGFQCYVLKYKGLDVAVFWKRQTSEVRPDPEDPVPEGVVENPDDVWVRLDLFSKSPRQLVGAVAEELDACNNEIARLKFELAAKDRVLEANRKTIASLRGKS